MGSHLHAVAMDRIQTERLKYEKAVTEGMGIDDYPAYREAVGYIRGLENAQKLLTEADDDILKGR